RSNSKGHSRIYLPPNAKRSLIGSRPSKNGPSNSSRYILRPPTALSFSHVRVTTNYSPMQISPTSKRSALIQSAMRSASRRKKEIIALLTANATEIVSGSVVVLYIDECHLIWDEAEG